MHESKTVRKRRRGIRGRRALLVAAVGAMGTLGLFAATTASAHFVLVAPDSWMSQTGAGDPQKLGPCGNEGGGTVTGKVTAFHPGQTISVTISEVVHHPGHYRAALSVLDRSELPADPLITPTPSDPCASAVIQDPPVFPVLVDNALAHTGTFAGPQTFMVTLPSDVTCTHCTLQIVEYMSSHGAPCFYHHCADISIQDEVIVCGDGQIQTGEQCDDGNVADSDGCDSQCALECGPIAGSTLTVNGLATPPGDEKINFRGSLTLPLPVSPALDPVANGCRLLIDGSGGTALDVTIPGGSGWTVKAAGTKWVYRSSGAAPSGGISRVVIQDKSAITPGLVKYIVRGRGASVAIGSGDLPVTARMIVASSGGQCGDTSFASCALSGTGSTLKCR